MLELSELWTRLRPRILPDGTLRDVHIGGASEADWNAFLNWVRDENVPHSFQCGWAPAPLPDSFSEIASLQDDGATMLNFQIGKLSLNAHFFCEDEMEFDFDPRDVKDIDRFSDLMAFMAQIGQLVSKPVKLTEESAPDLVIFELPVSVEAA